MLRTLLITCCLAILLSSIVDGIPSNIKGTIKNRIKDRIKNKIKGKESEEEYFVNKDDDKQYGTRSDKDDWKEHNAGGMKPDKYTEDGKFDNDKPWNPPEGRGPMKNGGTSRANDKPRGGEGGHAGMAEHGDNFQGAKVTEVRVRPGEGRNLEREEGKKKHPDMKHVGEAGDGMDIYKTDTDGHVGEAGDGMDMDKTDTDGHVGEAGDGMDMDKTDTDGQNDTMKALAVKKKWHNNDTEFERIGKLVKGEDDLKDLKSFMEIVKLGESIFVDGNKEWICETFSGLTSPYMFKHIMKKQQEKALEVIKSLAGSQLSAMSEGDENYGAANEEDYEHDNEKVYDHDYKESYDHDYYHEDHLAEQEHWDKQEEENFEEDGQNISNMAMGGEDIYDSGVHQRYRRDIKRTDNKRTDIQILGEKLKFFMKKRLFYSFVARYCNFD